MDLAAPVSERVQIMTICLAESVAKLGTVRERLPAKLAMGVNVETGVDKQRGFIQVRPRFTLAAKYEDSNEDELLRIEAVFLLQYRVPSFKRLRKASIAAFGELNGLFNAWPYWREFVQSTTVRMGLPALTIPVYRPLDSVTSASKPPPGRELSGKGSDGTRAGSEHHGEAEGRQTTTKVT